MGCMLRRVIIFFKFSLTYGGDFVNSCTYFTDNRIFFMKSKAVDDILGVAISEIDANIKCNALFYLGYLNFKYILYIKNKLFH